MPTINSTRSGLTQQRLRELLDYDPETGIFVRRTTTSWNARKGSVAGGDTTNGYHFVSVDGVRYLAQRLAWLYVHGRWPIGEVDHRNGDRRDNRIDNLRDATHSQNGAHRHGPAAQNLLGIRGVERLPSGRYSARVYVNGRNRRLGTFDTAAEAAQVAADERAARFGEYAGQT